MLRLNNKKAANPILSKILVTFIVFILIILILGLNVGLMSSSMDISEKSDTIYTPQDLRPIVTRASENNSPPYFLIPELPDLDLDEDFGAYSFNLTGLADDNEDTPDQLRFFITGENESLIDVTFENSSSQAIIIKSVSDAYGENNVKLWVVDTTGRNSFQTFRIKIRPLNDLPSISNLPDLKIHRGKPYSINLNPYIIDPDTPKSQIDIKVKPEDRDREYASLQKYTLNLDFKSTTEFTKNYITLELSDKIGQNSQKINIVLTNNYPPETLLSIPNIILYRCEPLINILDLDYYFFDPDNEYESLTYDFVFGDDLNIKINSDNSVDIDPTECELGTKQIIFRCSDPDGAFHEQIVYANIPYGDPSIYLAPLPNLMVHHDQEYLFNLTPYLLLENQQIKPDYEANEFHINNWIKSNELSNILFSEDHPNIMRLNFSEQYLNQTIPVHIHANSGSSSSFQEFLVKVTDNYPPMLQKPIPDRQLKEDGKISSALDLYEYFYDSEDGNLEFVNIDENVVLDIKVNGLADISVKDDWYGDEQVVVRGIDSAGAIVEDSFMVSVRPINDAPEILPIPQINLTQGKKETFSYKDFIFDVDNNISDLTVNVNSKYLTVAGWYIIFDYPDDMKGSHSFSIIVDDGELSSSRSVNVTISKQDLNNQGEENPLLPIMFWSVTGIILILIIISLLMGVIYIRRLKSFKFDQIFLIYSDGLLIAHAPEKTRPGQDSDIFSAMFTAIQNFIHDSFSDDTRSPDSWPLRRLDFGDFKIVIDRGEFIYIAAVFKGFPIRKMLLRIERLREKIENKYADVLPTWAGDMNQLKGTQELLNNLLFSANLRTPPKRSGKKPKQKPTDENELDDINNEDLEFDLSNPDSDEPQEIPD
jgi:hypothetical protein